MNILSSFLVACLLGLNAVWLTESALLGSQGYQENYDSEFLRMLPDEHELRSRRRDIPSTDESYWSDEESNSNTNAERTDQTNKLYDLINFSTNLKNYPADYHNTTDFKIKMGNSTVDIKVTVNKSSKPGSSSESVMETVSSGNEKLETCSSTKPCFKGKYCQRSVFGTYCVQCMDLGEYCDTDAECCGLNSESSSLCVYGKCQNGYAKGEAGTLCSNTMDCNEGMCCASAFMSKGICKRLAKIDERCATSERSDFDLMRNGGLCPCYAGLICTNQNSDPWLNSLFGGMDIFGDKKCSPIRKKHYIK